MFDAKRVKDECVAWIREFFENNGKGCNAVVGISGGKDSSIAAALCVEALGKDRVIGVLMPQGVQHDIDKAYELVHHLGIKHYVVNIKDAVEGVVNNLPKDIEITSQTVQKNRLLILPSYCYQPISETLVLSTAGISILLREERKKKKE